MWAAQFGHTACLQHILEQCPSQAHAVNEVVRGWGGLHVVLWRQPSITTVHTQGASVATIAARMGNLPCLQLVLSYGIDPFVCDPWVRS